MLKCHFTRQICFFMLMKQVLIGEICDVAEENRPTGAYFIIEFDLRYFQLKLLFSGTDDCAARIISFLLFHSFFIVHRSVLTAGNLIKVKAQQSYKKFHL